MRLEGKCLKVKQSAKSSCMIRVKEHSESVLLLLRIMFTLTPRCCNALNKFSTTRKGFTSQSSRWSKLLQMCVFNHSEQLMILLISQHTLPTHLHHCTCSNTIFRASFHFTLLRET